MYFLQVLCFLLLSVAEFNLAKLQSIEEDQTSIKDASVTTRNKNIAKRVLYLIDELDHHPPRCLRELVNVKFSDVECHVYMYVCVCTKKMCEHSKHQFADSSDEHSDSSSADKSTSDDGKSTEDQRPFKGYKSSIFKLMKPRYKVKPGPIERCYRCHVAASIKKDHSIKGIIHHKCKRTTKYDRSTDK